jgi:hypothetical protein
MLGLAAVACDIHWVREVRRTPAGGEVALIQQNADAQAQAQQLMATRCPQGYDILEEGEVVVGQEVHSNTQSNTQQGRSIFGPAQTTSQSTTASTTDKREWRIKYQCKGAAGAPPAATPAPTTAPTPAGANATGSVRVGAIHEIIIVR